MNNTEEAKENPSFQASNQLSIGFNCGSGRKRISEKYKALFIRL